MQTKQEFGGIDATRFAAAVGVALYHYLFWAWAFPGGLSGEAASLPPQQWLGTSFASGWVGVQIFFVISGFVIAFSAERSTARRFVWSRFRRLVPAVLICAPLTAFVLLATDAGYLRQVIEMLARSVAFIPFGPWVDSVYWTLGIEIAFYALVWALLVVGRFDRIEDLAAIIGSVSTSFWLVFWLWGFDDALAKARALELLLVSHGCFFGTGILLWAMKFRGYSARRLGWTVFFTLGGMLQIAAAAEVVTVKTGWTVAYAAPVAFYLAGLGFIAWSLSLRLTSPIWRQIGIATYPLYLIHNVVGAALIGLLFEWGTPYLSAVAIALLVSIALSWLIAAKLEPMVLRLFSFVRGAVMSDTAAQTR